MEYITKNERETIAFAEMLATVLKPGMTLLLEGNLGAGKTTFTKGIGRGLEIDRLIKSPSYTIVREYQEGTMPLYHIDLYRLDEEEVMELGLEEYFGGDGLVVVEWASVSPEDMPEEYLAIKLAVDPTQPEQRTIALEAYGEEYKEIIKKMTTE